MRNSTLRVGALWACVTLLVLLAACSSGPAPDVLPANLANLQRASMREIAVKDAPEPVSSVERIVEAIYGVLTVRVYKVPASAIGLDFVQRWQAPPNVDYFYEGSYVAVISWTQAERPDLRDFSAALRAHLRTL